MNESFKVARAIKTVNILFLRYVLAVITPCLLLASCTDDQPGERTEKPVVVRHIASENTALKPFRTSSEACGSNQLAVMMHDQYYVGPKCEHIGRNLDAERFLQKYISLCQEKTQASKPPASVASVRITACGPAQGKAGITYSRQVCCDIPKNSHKQKTSPEKFTILAYEAKLNCPKTNQQALATYLHSPGKSCRQNIAAFKGGPSGSSHYQKACRGGNDNIRPQVLDAAVFTCREDNSGSYLDVAVCCSTTLPAGKTMHPLTVPDDIWEIMRTGDLFALQLLLSREPQHANDKGKANMSPLHVAGRVSFINVLLAKQADIEARDVNGFTPLHFAAGKTQLEVVALLLKRGAKVDALSIHGDTPLGSAKSLEIADLLLSSGANPSGASTLTSPLHSAAFSGRVKIVGKLIEHGAKIDQTNAQGETPLHLAAKGYGQTSIEVVRMLINNAANINALSKTIPPKTPLDMAKKDTIRGLILKQGGKSAKK